MAGDDRIAFYLRNWALIEEWHALRVEAVATVEAALRHAMNQPGWLDEADARCGWAPGSKSPTTYQLDRHTWCRDGWRVTIALQWNPDQLLTADGVYAPYVGVRISGEGRPPGRFVNDLRDRLRPAALTLGWDQEEPYWLLWRYVHADTGGVDPDELAGRCRAALVDGWHGLAALIDDFFAGQGPERSIVDEVGMVGR